MMSASNGNKRRVWFVKLLLVLFLLFLPAFSGNFMIYLMSLSLIFGIFAMAYDLLFGYTGQVSFGHSVFYGVSAYSVGIVASTVFSINNPLILFATAIAVGAFLGTFVGFFCSYSRGIYLALVTFAFAQIFWLLILSDPGGITLGENGIMGFRPSAIIFGNFALELFKGTAFYYLILAILVGSYLCILGLVKSPLGDVLKGIKQNEHRLMSLGYNTRPYKILAFTLSGAFSGIAGILMAFLNNSIEPSMVDWHVGAQILLICILGGPGTLLGPILGAVLIVFTEHYASSWVGGGNWVYILGGLYICVVMFFPGGILNTKWGKFLK